MLYTGLPFFELDLAAQDGGMENAFARQIVDVLAAPA
jgi:hypothetical protein